MQSIDSARAKRIQSALNGVYKKTLTYRDELVSQSEIVTLINSPTNYKFIYAGKPLHLDGIAGKSEPPLIGYTKQSYQAFFSYIISDIYLRRRSPQTITSKIVATRWINAFCGGNIVDLDRSSMDTIRRFHTFLDQNSAVGLERKYLYINQFIAFLGFLSKRKVIQHYEAIKCTISKSEFDALDPTTEEFKLRREKKIIEDDFLFYICKSKISVYGSDKFSSFDRLLIQSIPFFIGMGLRVGEICSLPYDCIVERDDGTYLRVWSEKTSSFDLRYIPSMWSASILESVHEIKSITRSAREIATMLSHGKLIDDMVRKARKIIASSNRPRPVVDNARRGSLYLYISEIEQLGFPRTYVQRKSKAGDQSPILRVSSADKGCLYAVDLTLLLKDLFNSLIIVLSNRYGSNIPLTWKFSKPSPELYIERNAFRAKQALEENLFIILVRQSSSSATSPIPFPDILRPNHFTDFFSSPKNARTSIFDRCGLQRESGSRIRISPHQFRHWVTSAFHRYGANDYAVDMWMGRSTGQNRNYDLRTSAERAQRVREIIGENDEIGRSSYTNARKRADYQARASESAHSTPWGICSRDLQVSPCERHLTCIKGFGTERGCKNFVFDPDDKEALLAVIKLRDFAASQASIVSSIQTGFIGASMVEKHLDHHRETVRSCEAIIKKFGGRHNVTTEEGH